MFRTHFTCTRLTFCALAIAFASFVLLGQSGNAAKPKAGGNGDVETRVQDLETTVADLVARVKRLESCCNDDDDEGAPNDARKQPKPKAARTWTIGSSKDAVLAIEGQPRTISKIGNLERWFFAGSDSVLFEDGKVKEWDNNSGKLRCILR